ncbi:MAG: nucleotidyltransferase domain-containing protein [Rhabdochlamydiaceae bacterium]|nr:nucleotidyltransferase domain-containing protein [Rhabdochlamydiaceae bacterium]
MRLSKEQIETIIQAAHRSFGNTSKIWLFGSRVDDHKKGGDIDLYIETDKEIGIVSAKLEMLGLLDAVFGEQKIDILVRRRNRPCSAMHVIAKSSGQELV